jgi:hypothetical protein
MREAMVRELQVGVSVVPTQTFYRIAPRRENSDQR